MAVTVAVAVLCPGPRTVGPATRNRQPAWRDRMRVAHAGAATGGDGFLHRNRLLSLVYPVLSADGCR